jgi:hypothetical protein
MRILKFRPVLSPQDGRAIRMGLVVLAPALSYYLVVKPYVSAARRMLDALQGQRILLLREEEVTANLPAIRAQGIVAADAARRTAPRTYSGTDGVLAMTAFGRDVTAALRETGLVIQRFEMRDSLPRREGVQELTIDVRAQGDFERILAALTRLEANSHLIQVSRLAIERAGEQQATGAEALSLVAVIHGYAQ